MTEFLTELNCYQNERIYLIILPLHHQISLISCSFWILPLPPDYIPVPYICKMATIEAV